MNKYPSNSVAQHKHEQVTIEVNGMQIECDKGCADMVAFLNQIGLITKFSCQGDEGQKPYIMLDENVTDDLVEEFLTKIVVYQKENGLPVYTYGTFHKWCRWFGKGLIYNWMYEPTASERMNMDYELFKEVYGEF